MEADLKAAAKAVSGLDIKREGPGAGRSDDSSFLDRRVPAINFFTGFHGDYHRPTDDWERDRRCRAPRRWPTLALELAASVSARGTTARVRVEVARPTHLHMGLLAILVVAALILVNAVYVAAEFAAVSVRRSRLRQLADDGNPLAAWLLP